MSKQHTNNIFVLSRLVNENKMTFRHRFYYHRSIFSSSTSRLSHGKKVVDEHFSSYFSLTKLTLMYCLQPWKATTMFTLVLLVLLSFLIYFIFCNYSSTASIISISAGPSIKPFQQCSHLLRPIVIVCIYCIELLEGFIGPHWDQ